MALPLFVVPKDEIPILLLTAAEAEQTENGKRKAENFSNNNFY